MNVLLKIVFGGTLAVVGFGGLMIMTGHLAGNEGLISDGWRFTGLGGLFVILELMIYFFINFDWRR